MIHLYQYFVLLFSNSGNEVISTVIETEIDRFA